MSAGGAVIPGPRALSAADRGKDPDEHGEHGEHGQGDQNQPAPAKQGDEDEQEQERDQTHDQNPPRVSLMRAGLSAEQGMLRVSGRICRARR